MDSKCTTSPGANLNISEPFSLPPAMRQTSSELYFSNEVLHRSSSLSEVGEPRWWMFLCLGITWLVNFLCLFKGIKTSSKVVYFTATFSYVIIFILLVRAITLEGASKVLYEQSHQAMLTLLLTTQGINYYIYPEQSQKILLGKFD